MGILATVRVNTTQGMILYRSFVIQQAWDGWEWTHEDYGHEATPQFLQVTGTCQTVFECIDAVEDWHASNQTMLPGDEQ